MLPLPAPAAVRFRGFGLGALILGLAFACYWPALRGGLLWDDQAHLTTPGLQSTTGLARIWFELNATQQYYPVLHSAFWLEHRLWGDATLGYHLVNVFLHAASACLLVLILRRLKIPGAPLAGLIFAVHPVGVESVAWMSEQKNTLSLVFYLLAALAYLRFDELRARAAGAAAGWCYFAASLLFALALLSKSVTATLPAALLVIAWWQRGRLDWRRDALPLLPWFVLAIASGLFTAWVERKLIGAEGASFDLSLVQRTLLAGRVLWFYLGKLLWPAHLIFFYPRWDVKSDALAWSGFLVAAVVVTMALWRIRDRSRGPLAGWLFFVGSLFPALGFFNVYPFTISYVADHFQYLASLGVFAGASAGFTVLLAHRSSSWRAAGWCVSGALIVLLMILSREQSRAYTDLRTLYTTTLERNPSAWIAHNNLGVDLLAEKSPAARDAAIAHFEAAVRLKPDYATAHYNLGDALLEIPERLNEAVEHDETALRLRPNYAEAHNNLGNALAKVPGRLGEAVTHYEEALRLNPAIAETHFNLGNAFMKMPGRGKDAGAQFEAVLQLNPNHAAAHNNLGILLADQPNRAAEAIAHYEAALRARPNYAEAHYNLGNALQITPGRQNDAIAQYVEALRLQPDHAESHNNLGGVLSKIPGRLGDAIAEHEAALRLKPDYAEAHFNLAVALLRTPNRRAEAAAHFDEFLRLWPNQAQARQLVGQYQTPR